MSGSARASEIVALVSLLSACGEPSIDRIWVDLPPHSGARSMVIAIDLGTRFELFAYSLDDTAQPFIPELDVGEGASLEALVYEAPLEALELTTGPVPKVLAGGRGLPEAKWLYAMDVTGGAGGTWSARTERSDKLESARIAESSVRPCTTFRSTLKYSLESNEDNAYALVLDRESVLIGTLDRKIAHVTPAGVRLVTVSPPELPAGAAVLDASGNIWFAGAGGVLWRGALRVGAAGAPEIEAEHVSTSTTGQTIRWLAGGELPGGGVELFALSEEGAFERFDGVRWELLFDFEPTPNNPKGGVVSPRPGEALAGRGHRPLITHYRDGATFDDSPPDLIDGITGLHAVPGFGVLAGTGTGNIFGYEAGAWSAYTGEPISLDTYAINTYRDGFVAGGALGYVAEYIPGRGFCPPAQLGTGSVRRFASFGEGLVLGEDKPRMGSITQLTVLEPQE